VHLFTPITVLSSLCFYKHAFFIGPANHNEYQNIRQQLEVEKMPGRFSGDPPRSFHQLSPAEQAQQEKKRLSGLRLIIN